MSAVEYKGGRIVKTAGQDLTGKKYYGVKLDGNGNAVLAAAGQAIGVLIEEGAEGESVSIQFMGNTKMIASAAMAAGVYGNTDANGKLAVAAAATANITTGAITGTKAFCITLEAASVAGEYIPVCIVHGGIVA